MDSNKRLILTIGISIVILLGYQWLVVALGLAPSPSSSTAGVEGGAVAENHQGPEEGAPRPSDGIEEAERPAEGRGEQPTPRGPVRQAELRTADLDLVFSSDGAGLSQALLLGRKGQRQGGAEAPQVDLAANLGPEEPLLFDLALGQGFNANFGPRGDCQLGPHDEESVSFRCPAGPIEIVKKFSLRGDRSLDLAVTVHNRGNAPAGGDVELFAPAAVDPSRQKSSGGCGGLGGPPPQPTKAICRNEDKLITHMYDSDKPLVAPAGNALFAGIEERYFLAVAVPDKRSSCELAGPSSDLLISTIRTATGIIAPGGSATINYQLVIGPKDMGFLQDESAAIAQQAKIENPHLDDTVDLGFWAVIARVLLWLLRAFHHVIPNWGVAIILLTIAVKLVTLPLAWKSMKSMEEMRKLAPEIAALKKKYGDDREKLNLETMKLYQQHKVNPLGGCLPMLIQMPIWLALYTTLQTSVELYNEPFIGGWISDLTSKDPYYALPLAMGVTMFITQRMQPMQMDATQQKVMLYFMPIFFTFIMLQLPAGLTLYIFTNNILSIGQQLILRKQMGLPAIGAPTAPASSATIEAKPSRKTKK